MTDDRKIETLARVQKALDNNEPLIVIAIDEEGNGHCDFISSMDHDDSFDLMDRVLDDLQAQEDDEADHSDQPLGIAPDKLN